MKHRLHAFWMVVLILFTAAAVGADETLDNRVHELSKDLRCLKCQNQSIADSKSNFADMVRAEVKDQLQQGKSEKEVKDFLVGRYGSFIVYEPPFTMDNLFLWVFPLGLIILALWALFQFINKQGSATAGEEIGDEQLAEVDRLIREKQAKGES